MPHLRPYIDSFKANAETLPHDSSPLFMSSGKLYSQFMIRRLWDNIIRTYETAWTKKQSETTLESGALTEVVIPPRRLTAHMFRHTFATILYDAGIDVKTAQKWMGDSTVSVVMDIYTHLSASKEKEAEERLRNYLSGNKFDNTVDNTTTTKTAKIGGM